MPSMAYGRMAKCSNRIIEHYCIAVRSEGVPGEKPMIVVGAHIHPIRWEKRDHSFSFVAIRISAFVRRRVASHQLVEVEQEPVSMSDEQHNAMGPVMVCAWRAARSTPIVSVF